MKAAAVLQNASCSREHFSVGFAEYIPGLTDYLRGSHGSQPGRVRLQLELESVYFPVTMAVPCGLILNELLSDASRHAFRPGEEGLLSVPVFAGDDGALRPSVGDNGCGLPGGFDWTPTSTLGLRLVRKLTEQLHPEVRVDGGAGTAVALTLRGWGT